MPALETKCNPPSSFSHGHASKCSQSGVSSQCSFTTHLQDEPLSVNRLEQRDEIHVGVGLPEACTSVSLYRISSITENVLSPDGELG